jgi:hypothetical protein
MGVTALAGLTPGRLAASTPGDIRFTVRAAGGDVGHHRLTFRQQDDRLHVAIDVRIRVRLLFVTVFDYAQTAEEVWRGGRLEAFSSDTSDGDNMDSVRAVRDEAGVLQVASRRFGERAIEGDIWPSSAFWRPAAVERTEFLDAARGDIREAVATLQGLDRIDALGEQRMARRYSVRSSRDFDVWYGSDGAWLGLEWGGFGVTARYRRVA